jgi:ABC-type dipeptide/oligopeptide/nickel transport system permease subunit
MWKQPYFPEVMVASVFGWVLGMVKGFSGAKDWLDRYWVNSPKFVVFFLDLLIFVVCGAFFGTGIYNPESLQAALAAGLSWPVGLGALATK